MPISDLTGTTWEINGNPTTYTEYSHAGNYSINYHFGGISYGNTVAVGTSFRINPSGPPDFVALLGLFGDCNGIDGQTNISPSDYVSSMVELYNLTEMAGIDSSTGEYVGTSLYFYDNGGAPWSGSWTLTNHIIEILGGTDATNANLIDWLTKNATYISGPAGDVYIKDIKVQNTTIPIAVDKLYLGSSLVSIEVSPLTINGVTFNLVTQGLELV